MDGQKAKVANIWQSSYGPSKKKSISKMNKWDKKAKKKFLVGYCENIKDYLLYDPVARNIIIARYVVVMENIDDSSATMKIGHLKKREEQDTSVSQKDEIFIPGNSSSNTDTSYSDILSPEEMDLVFMQRDSSTPENV